MAEVPIRQMTERRDRGSIHAGCSKPIGIGRTAGLPARRRLLRSGCSSLVTPAARSRHAAAPGRCGPAGSDEDWRASVPSSSRTRTLALANSGRRALDRIQLSLSVVTSIHDLVLRLLYVLDPISLFELCFRVIFHETSDIIERADCRLTSHIYEIYHLNRCAEKKRITTIDL